MRHENSVTSNRRVLQHDRVGGGGGRRGCTFQSGPGWQGGLGWWGEVLGGGLCPRKGTQAACERECAGRVGCEVQQALQHDRQFTTCGMSASSKPQRLQRDRHVSTVSGLLRTIMIWFRPKMRVRPALWRLHSSCHDGNGTDTTVTLHHMVRCGVGSVVVMADSTLR